MSVLVDSSTRVLVQGITGKAGAFHARHCLEYGTQVVAGVTPGRGGELFDGKVPVYDTVRQAAQNRISLSGKPSVSRESLGYNGGAIGAARLPASPGACGSLRVGGLGRAGVQSNIV